LCREFIGGWWAEGFAFGKSTFYQKVGAVFVCLDGRFSRLQWGGQAKPDVGPFPNESFPVQTDIVVVNGRWGRLEWFFDGKAGGCGRGNDYAVDLFVGVTVNDDE